MPIYEYRCEHCGDFEEMQRISDPAIERCPKCRRKVRRLISSTSFQLKGSGWYVTDYGRSGGGSNGKKKESGESSASSGDSSSSSSSDKSEKKSEKKSESSSTSEKTGT
jgi:putative FmdB family regulatory protein